MAVHSTSSIPLAYPMFSDYWPPSFQTGWQTVCPRLLSPDAVPVPYLLTPGRLARPPSPTPTMSSEDEPAVQRTAVAGHQQLPLLPPPPPRPAEMSSSTPTTASMSAPASKEASASSDGVATPSTSDGIRSAIFNTQKLNEEPKPIEFATPSAPASNGSHKPRPSRWTKARSTSTESFVSSMGIPATLGSQYNQEGFPNYPISSDDDEGDARIVADDDAIAKQLAQTDEAVRQINGTASVVQARNIGNMMPSAQSTNQYELPRSMAAYVQRQPRGDHRGERGELKTGGSFVSSGSSTSSEESEYFGSVQWVQSAAQPTNTNMSNYPFYYTNPSGAANPKMPPPATIGNRKLNSPRRGSNSGLPSSGPATPNALPPKGLPANSVPPADASAVETPTENDDDDQTVGGPNREGSPSSSSASGLDLLIHAAEHHERNRYSTYIKRKKGAEAVAQWRQSGIPTGPSRADRQPAFDNSPGYESTPSDGQAQDNGSAEPPKKRRRSEMKLEAPDSNLRKPPSEPSEAESDIESQGSASESEYQGGKRGRRNSNKGKQKSRVRATLPIPQSGASGASQSPAKESPTPKKAQPKQRRPSNTSDTKPGALPAGGVQCEYVNPLPPYQRCPDVFTRKYDIPRHMARHARREGDLVTEGKLPEEKAMLWKTIRDKPRIRCKVCLEYFTRQDALKRHQNKQHHH